MTSLVWAAGRGHVKVVKELLQAGADNNAADKVIIINFRTYF